WNPSAEQIFGYTADEMLGREAYGTIVAEDVRPQVEEVWKRLISGDESAHSVNDNLTKSGKTVTCEWYNTPVRDANNRIVGVISMVLDVTER
ncbi:MAG: PAS domain S-box protein, partial [Gammaproteobacteria bacterium]|nr:PAS domain S-box protein [Gammaproteobacteria bacterium]NIR47471.1 PAS domain S-box protein [candidate division KSB1 bacterium]NIV68872.1 PAS domain S-box protein [Phycisphaerae bacterium]NIQ11252.1 PAS domain S-box protein [Gammaproteobacteria bacterium]NIS23076.1 PAS domain S-box protein [candidate division KSB1 bacterium]